MPPINVTTSKQQITASVAEDKISATVTGGFGATGPSGVINVTAPITNAGTTTAANVGLSVGSGLSVSGGSLVVTPDTYATLVGGKVPAEQLPSYVDDVLEYANLASLPVTGESGKIYVALNTGKIYRWSGSAYFEISTQPGNTDAVPEGSSNLYFTNARARNAFGTGTTGQVITWSGGEWTAATPTTYTLPTATASVLGGVKIGSGISIDGNGVISASSGYTLPTATNSVLGGVKIGSGVTITDGVISVSTNYAAATHNHSISDVTGLQTALDGKAAAAIGSDAGKIVVTTTGGVLTTAASIAASQVASSVATSNFNSINVDAALLGIDAVLDGKASATHVHSAADIASGTFDVSLLPVGTGSTQVAAGDHTHAQLHDRSHAINSSSDHTATAWRVFYSDATGVQELALGASGTVLTSGGTSAAPSFTALAASATTDTTNASNISSGTLAAARIGTHASTHQTGGSDAITNVVVSPSQITGNQNDYSPGTGDIVRLSSDAARNITGITAGTSGEVRVLVNVGSNTITLVHQSASSTAGNRFLVSFGSDYLIAANAAAVIVYDGTTSRWRVI